MKDKFSACISANIDGDKLKLLHSVIHNDQDSGLANKGWVFGQALAAAIAPLFRHLTHEERNDFVRGLNDGIYQHEYAEKEEEDYPT